MSNRLQIKLEDRLRAGDYYEAHQIYRTIYYRLVRDPTKKAEVYQLLCQGALKLLECNQLNSGADLANTLIEVLVNLKSLDEIKQDQQTVLFNIKSMFSLMKVDSPERAQFINKSLKITCVPVHAIRKQFAQVLWSEKSYAAARLHFIYSSDSGEHCALMLIEYQQAKGYPNEIDLIIAQFVLQVLCCENVTMANQTFFEYTRKHPGIKKTQPPFSMPLLNFVYFLLSSVNCFTGQSVLFKTLCSLYERSLARDPSYREYLNQIGQIYFGIEKPAQSSGSGMFSNLIQSLFDNMSSGNEDQSSTPTQSQPANVQSSSTTRTALRNEDVDLD